MTTPSDLSAAARSLAKHRARFEALTRPATDLILREAGAARTVVDLASGTGDPALALAAALPDARVLASDRSAALLAEADREARARGLKNLHTLQTDMHRLPLRAASVELVTSRLGIQFAEDVPRVLAEISRVLAPGGVTCHVVWGAKDQPLLRALLPATAPFVVGAPGPFQFSRPGALADAFAHAGFVDVVECTRRADWTWDGAARSFWRFMQDTSGAALAESERVLASLAAFQRGRSLVFPVEVHRVRARRA